MIELIHRLSKEKNMAAPYVYINGQRVQGQYAPNYWIYLNHPRCDPEIINLNNLGIQKKTNTQYWLVAIGKQNQLSSLVALN